MITRRAFEIASSVLSFICAFSVIAPGRVAAQACLGTPLKQDAVAVEAHYSRLWVFRGLGASASAHVGSGIYGRAAYTHTNGAHAGSLRSTWEIPGRPYSACPSIGVTYTHHERGHSVSIPVGFAISASGPGDAYRRTLLYAFPHLVHSRYHLTAPDDVGNATAFVTEIGLRMLGASYQAGASVGFVSESGRSEALFGLTAGVRTGGIAADSSSPARTYVRERFGFSAGVIWVDPGENPITQCDAGAGFALGAELRTRGAWLAAAGIDLMANLAVACTTVLYMREFNGRMVSVHNTPFVAGPRIRIGVGRSFAVGSMIFEPAVAAGFISMSTDEPSDHRFASKWHGGTLTARPRHSSKALHFEYGWREVPFSYYDERTRVHTYIEREPMARLVFEF